MFLPESFLCRIEVHKEAESGQNYHLQNESVKGLSQSRTRVEESSNSFCLRAHGSRDSTLEFEAKRE